MAPPSFGPPGYAIPERYRNRTPPPDGTDTNTRPYLILFAYFTWCFFVTTFVLRRIVRRYAYLRNSKVQVPPKKHLSLFGVLAVGSLTTVWTFMLKYFQISYQTWLMWRSYYDLDPSHRHWGLWLRETSLFQELWEVAIIGNARYWWTHQIFFFALVLGLYLEQKALNRSIRHTWVFMLVGQMIAVSFATNLLFLTLLVNQPPTASNSTLSFSQSRRRIWWVVNIGAVLAISSSAFLLRSEHYWHHPTDFLPVILLPHLALLVPPFARAVAPYSSLDSKSTREPGFEFIWVLACANALLMLLTTTWTAYSYAGFNGIQSALLEHPAVSAIAFDVIFCWLSWGCWYVTKGNQSNPITYASMHRVQESFEEDGSTILMKSNTYDSVRHR